MSVLCLAMTVMAQPEDHRSLEDSLLNFHIYDPVNRFLVPRETPEASGLLFYKGNLWTHNDSGNTPALFALDTLTGKVMQTITLKGANNGDWEDIAHDEDHFYIGDFGNNLGDRRDLVIYKVRKSEIPVSGDATVSCEKISFRYADQSTFKPLDRYNDFDCEAMVASEENLYLYSKNWVNNKTRIYKISKMPGNYTIEPVSEFDSYGIITGADYKNGQLALIGSRNRFPFIWLFNTTSPENISTSNGIRIDLPFQSAAQIEGVAFTDSLTIWLSSEQKKNDTWFMSLSTTLPPKEADFFAEWASMLENWQVTWLEEPKSSKKYFAVDVTALSFSSIRLKILNKAHKPVFFRYAGYDRHMGKIYLKLDVTTLMKGEYQVMIISGEAESHRKISIF